MENPPFFDYGKGRQHFLLSPEERLAAAQQVAHLWNVGKVLNPGVGD